MMIFLQKINFLISHKHAKTFIDIFFYTKDPQKISIFFLFQSASNKLEYMIRLDCLSTPNIYEADVRPKYSVIETDPEYPAAYARIRLHTSSFKVWGDYTNSSGYLRR